MVTAPLQKSTINDAGVAFSGHTEYLAEKTGTAQVVMMLAGPAGALARPLRVALATTHLPLSAVSGAISAAGQRVPRVEVRGAAHDGERTRARLTGRETRMTLRIKGSRQDEEARKSPRARS